MPTTAYFPGGRQLAAGVLLVLSLTGGPRAGQAAVCGWPGLRAGQHAAEQRHTQQRHRKGLLHWLVWPGCTRHHRVR